MKIQISKIRPNPNNPRHVLRQDVVDKLAASMKEVGQKNAVKLAALTASEKEADPGREFELIAGHYRYAAAKQNGLSEIEAVVLDLSPEQRMLEAILDNKGQPMTWLDEYRNIEAMRAINPKLTTRELADMLEVSQTLVSCSDRVLPLLSSKIREILEWNPLKTGGWEVSEAAVLAIVDIATGKPETLAEDQCMVERALKVVIERKMTEKQAKKLAEWVKQGNTPESFPVAGKKPKSATPDATDSPASPTAIPSGFLPYKDLLPDDVSIRLLPDGNCEIIRRVHAHKAPLAVFGGLVWETALEQILADGKVNNPANPYRDKWQSMMDEAVRKIREGEARSKPPSGSSSGSGVGSENAVNPKPGTRNPEPGTIQHMKDIASAIVADAPSTIVGKLFKAGVKRLFK